MYTTDRFEMKLAAPYRKQAEEIAAKLSEKRPEISRPISVAEAIRYAIAFTHTTLTEGSDND